MTVLDYLYEMSKGIGPKAKNTAQLNVMNEPYVDKEGTKYAGRVMYTFNIDSATRKVRSLYSLVSDYIKSFPSSAPYLSQSLILRDVFENYTTDTYKLILYIRHPDDINGLNSTDNQQLSYSENNISFEEEDQEYCLTVGELKKFLSLYDDNTPIRFASTISDDRFSILTESVTGYFYSVSANGKKELILTGIDSSHIDEDDDDVGDWIPGDDEFAEECK